MEKTFTLEIMQYAPPGRGMGFRDDKAVFVPCTTIGDQVEVAIVKEGKKHIEARLVKILKAGADRIEPACSHFNLCGGCDLLHLDYKKQIKLKKKMFKETLSSCGLDLNPEVIPSPEVWHSRHKASLRAAGGRLGMNERWSKQLIEIPDCKSLCKPILEKIPEIKALADIEASYPLLASAATGTIAGKRYLKKKEGEIKGFAHAVHEDYGYGSLELLAAGFAQSNPYVTAMMLADMVANLTSATQAEEYYAGSGTITTAIASKCEKLSAFEINKSAVKASKRNIERLKLEHIKFTVADAKQAKIAEGTDLVVLDPPRAGIDHALMKSLKKRKPAQIAYMSCNPATFARDLEDLLELGYKVKFLQGYDMYPHSLHLEVLSVLEFTG